MAKGEDFGFKGSQAVAGIKGTTFILEDTGKSTTLKVIEGDVELMDKANGKTEMVHTGESLSAYPTGLGVKTEFDIDKENASWESLSGIKQQNDSPEKKDFGLNYGFWIALLAAIVGGGWVVKKRKG